MKMNTRESSKPECGLQCVTKTNNEGHKNNPHRNYQKIRWDFFLSKALAL